MHTALSTIMRLNHVLEAKAAYNTLFMWRSVSICSPNCSTMIEEDYHPVHSHYQSCHASLFEAYTCGE